MKLLGRLLKSIATLFSLFAVIWAVDLSAQQPAHLSANYKAIFDQAQILAKDLGYTEQELIEAFDERPEETLAFLQKQTAEKRRRTTLESVKTIYVLPNRQPGSSRFDLDVVSQFMQWEKAPKHMGDIKSQPIGICSGGYLASFPASPSCVLSRKPMRSSSLRAVDIPSRWLGTLTAMPPATPQVLATTTALIPKFTAQTLLLGTTM